MEKSKENSDSWVSAPALDLLVLKTCLEKIYKVDKSPHCRLDLFATKVPNQ